jgi:hypothetical protein
MARVGELRASAHAQTLNLCLASYLPFVHHSNASNALGKLFLLRIRIEKQLSVYISNYTKTNFKQGKNSPFLRFISSIINQSIKWPMYLNMLYIGMSKVCVLEAFLPKVCQRYGYSLVPKHMQVNFLTKSTLPLDSSRMALAFPNSES